MDKILILCQVRDLRDAIGRQMVMCEISATKDSGLDVVPVFWKITLYAMLKCKSDRKQCDLAGSGSVIYMTRPLLSSSYITSVIAGVGPWAIDPFNRKMAHWQLNLLY